MAHFIYEYSANLPADQLDLPGLMEKMHTAAAASGIFPLSGMRSRAIRCEDFRIGDGHFKDVDFDQIFIAFAKCKLSECK